MLGKRDFDDDKTFAQFTLKIEQVIFHARVDYLRHMSRLQAQEDLESMLPEALIYVSEPDVRDETLEDISSDERLIKAIKALRPQEKQVMTYTVIHELSMKETATLAGVTLDNEYKLRRAAIKKLRIALNREEHKI